MLNSLTFQAIGNGSVPLSCASGAEGCKAVSSPLLIRGSLIQPVSVTPVYAEGPTGHDKVGCTAAAQNPNWSLSTIYYDYETEGNSVAKQQENFALLLTNPSIGYEASCITGGSGLDLNSGIRTLTCVGGEFQDLKANAYTVSTSATFHPNTNVFSVNQTWFCDDVDPGKP
jgi:hypothetical protein